MAPSLLAWIDATCDWELNRRQGFEYSVLPPEAAIPAQEDAASVSAAMAMRATFAQNAPAVCGFFDALAELLTGAGKQRWRRNPAA